MKKIFTLCAAALCSAVMYAVPAPTNVHFEGTTLKWELPDLTGDTVYQWVNVSLRTQTGVTLYATSGNVKYQVDLSEYLYKGRTYYAIVKSNAKSTADDGAKWSEETRSSDYTVPGVKDTLEFPNVTLNVSGEVGWAYDYQKVRATLQKKNGLDWDDINTHTVGLGYNSGWSFGAISTPGTYRAIADLFQDEEVVRRGISNEVEIAEMFTVTFNANGLDPFTVPDPVVTAKNSVIGEPDIDATYQNQEGHFFYWSTDEAGDNIWYFDTAHVTANITLYAQWFVLPALNPVWDVDTCRWTLAEEYHKLITNCITSVLTKENGNVVGVSGSARNHWFSSSDYYFSGREYKFTVTLKDAYHNEISATSALRTIAGEAATLPLTNMAVADASVAKVTWDAPIDVPYLLSGTLYRWNKGISDWETVKTENDAAPKTGRTKVQFDVALDAEQYYRIRCQLNQGEYKIYEGEMFYGTNPATGVDEIVNGQSSNRKFIKDGQLFIERDGKTFNAQGVEVR